MKYRTPITNPTGVKKIERQNFDISIDFPKVILSRLDVSALELSRDFCISLIGQAGYTEQIIKLGTVGQNKIPHSENLSDLDSESSLRFRLIIYDPESNLVKAACEGIRARLETEDERNPLLSVEPKPLGEHLWKLEREEMMEPVLHVNNDPTLKLLDIFRGQGDQDDPLFRALVIPNALQEALIHMFNHSDLEWAEPWKKWVDTLGQQQPEDVDGDDVQEWAKKCVDTFLKKTSLKDHSIEYRKRNNG